MPVKESKMQFAKELHKSISRATIKNAKRILASGYEAKLPEAIINKKYLKIPITKERAEELKRIIKKEKNYLKNG